MVMIKEAVHTLLRHVHAAACIQISLDAQRTPPESSCSSLKPRPAVQRTPVELNLPPRAAGATARTSMVGEVGVPLEEDVVKTAAYIAKTDCCEVASE
jgi:hypothetical protein